MAYGKAIAFNAIHTTALMIVRSSASCKPAEARVVYQWEDTGLAGGGNILEPTRKACKLGH
jgi:hypothetical protein